MTKKQNIRTILNRQEFNFQPNKIIKLENHNCKRVSHFNYLRSILTNNNDIQLEIDSRLKKGDKCYYGFRGIRFLVFSKKKINIKRDQTINLFQCR